MVQLLDPQSTLFPQLLPSLHVMAQTGGLQVPPPQTPDPQSEPAVHAWPSLQSGEQTSGAGTAWHFPLLQVPDAQSEPLSQALPATQVGLHAGLAQAAAVQTPDAQSELAPQTFPWGQLGAQPGA
jgi:hypothetical protein